MKCEECLVQPCCIGDVNCFLHQISETKPFIVTIVGNTNPTYSDNSFFECLINEEKTQFEFGQNTVFRPVDISIEEWIWNTIKKIHPDYIIMKFKGLYVVGEYTLEHPPYFTEEHGVCVEYGGIIDLHYK